MGMKEAIVGAASVFVLLAGLALWALIPAEDPDRIKEDERIAAPPPGVELGTLEVVGVGPADPVPIGQRVEVRFFLRNPGRRPVIHAGSLEGSSHGRSPACWLSIRDAEGREEKPQPPSRCGNQNSLESGDFRRLGAGETETQGLVSDIGWWKPSHPGVYTVTMTYDTSSPYIEAWTGRDGFSLGPRARELLSVVPKGRFTSNVVTVTIVP